LAKLERLTELGLNPYPSTITLSGERIKIDEARELLGQKVLVAGRVWAIRSHGGAAFMDLKDFSGEIQLLFRKNF